MDVNERLIKRPATVALAAMVVLLVGALVWYRERVFFADASFVVFNVLNYKRFYIQEHRLGSFVTQMVPLIGQKFNVPVKTILIAYSLSFNVFYLAVSSFLYFAFRQYKLTIVMALYYLLFVTSSYYWTNNEIHQAVAWLFFTLGTMHYMHERNVNGVLQYLLFFVLAAITVSTHFIVIIPLVYIWVFLLMNREGSVLSMRQMWTYSALLATVVAIKFMFSISQPYDGAALHGVTHFSIKDILLSWRTPVIKVFVKRCFTLYWPAIFVLLAGLWSLYKTGNKRLLAWTIMSCVGYGIVMSLTYGGYDADFALFHIESEWMSLGIICAIPFAFFYLPSLKPATSTLVVTVIIVVRLGYIYAYAGEYEWRTEFKEKVFAEMKERGITKLALYADKDVRNRLMLDWSLPNECILMSVMNGDKPQRTFCIIDSGDNAKREALLKPHAISISFDMLVPENLNRQYFDIDTSTPYTIMAYTELIK